jgi:subtilisin-like proprotein convertase family protein
MTLLILSVHSMATYSILITFFCAFQSQPLVESEEGVHFVDTGFEKSFFYIETPEAFQSKAWRLHKNEVDKEGFPVAPLSGYQFFNRLVVESDSRTNLVRLISEFSDAHLEELETPGFYLIHVNTVLEAISLYSVLALQLEKGKVYLDVKRPLSFRSIPSDPELDQQWHLINALDGNHDVNVEGAWSAGITGNGVVIGIVDAGVEIAHPDLIGGYNAQGSQIGGLSSHGTSCAGVAVATANNGQGGAGIAYGAEWSKLYIGTSSEIADAFGHRNNINDIKSNSWGPIDDGRIAYMSTLESSALANAINVGRSGLGEIFVFAAGNGGTSDRTDYDSYASSRYTIAVGAIGDNDTRAPYNEQGSSMLVVTQSSGNNRDIYTTTVGSSYTNSFGGTSSACPLAAGTIALMLEANPNLTWRDVQAILIESARKCDPNNANWTTSAAGYDLNINYGYGAIDAGSAVSLAATWLNLPPEILATSGQVMINQQIPDNDLVGLNSVATITEDFIVESVELVLNVAHANIGDLWVRLTSPSGQHSVLAKVRDDFTDDYDNFLFTSMRHWGESSQGDWIVEIHDGDGGTVGLWEDFQINIYGHDANASSMVLSTPGITSGTTAVLDIAQGAPSSLTYIGYSLIGPGVTPVPSLGVSLGILNPVLLSTMLSDINGSATFFVNVPNGAYGRNVWLQAAQNSLVSNVLPVVVQ